MDLKIFLQKYGKNTSTNFQLIQWAKELNIPNFHVLMKDEVKDLEVKLNMNSSDFVTSTSLNNIICNLDTSKEKGIHWSCFQVGDRFLYFFDSFSLPPTDEIKEKFSGKEIIQNYFVIQKPGEKHCGQLCLFVLYWLNLGKKDYSFQDILVDLYAEIETIKISPLKMKDEISEKRIRKIVSEKTPKSITIKDKKYFIGKKMIKNLEKELEKEKEGGFLPLIPLIIGALTVAGSLAGGAAGITKAVQDKQANDVRNREERRHNKELEKIAKGGTIDKDRGGRPDDRRSSNEDGFQYLKRYNEPIPIIEKNLTKPIINTYVGDKITKSTQNITQSVNEFINGTNNLNDNEKKNLKQTLQLLSKSINISKVGKGLFLNPYNKEGNGIDIHLDKTINDFMNMQKNLNNEEKETMKNTLHKLSKSMKIDQKGNGLFLNPY